MLEQLLEQELLQLPEAKRPADVGKSKEPNYCKYHRLVGHPTEKCFVLKDKILELVTQGRIVIGLEDDVTTSNAVFVKTEPRTRIKLNKPRTSNASCCSQRRPPSNPTPARIKMLKPPSPPKPTPRQAAEEDKDGWILVTRRKKPYKEVAPVKITIRGHPQKKAYKKTASKHKVLPKVNKPKADRRKRRPITLAEFFPVEFINPPALVATCSLSPGEQMAKRKSKAPMAECDDLETSLKQISPTNEIQDDLDLPIRSHKALAKLLDKPEEMEAEVEKLEMRRNDEPKVGLSPPTKKMEEDA